MVKPTDKNSWQILPIVSKQTWKLTKAESHWILNIKNVPQLILKEKEAIAFLKSQHAISN